MSGPRLSIIPGEFATDPRADLAHFRVLNMIGRHADKSGWCKVRQLTLADSIGLTRETVNRKIKDLVKWGYVEKQENDRTGRSIWYRTILDRPVAPSALDDTPDPDSDLEMDADASSAAAVSGDAGAVQETHSSDRPVITGSHVGYNASAELHPTCDRTDHSSCDRIGSQQERLLNEVKTPTPQAGRSDDFSFEDDDGVVDGVVGAGTAAARTRTAIATLRAEGLHTAVLERLLVPLTAQRRFSAEDHEGALREIRRRAAGLSAPHLDKVLEIALAAPVKTVKAQRVLDAIDAVRRGGLMIVIDRRRDVAQWAAWARHFERGDPKQSALMARADKWQVRSAWPNGSDLDHLGETAP